MIELACPRCHSPLEKVEPDAKFCKKDRLTFRRTDGIWRMLLPERQAYFARFIQDYETVRRSEGRGSEAAEYYRTLPNHPSPDWKIRTKSFRTLLKVLHNFGEPLEIIDMGAGNGWLSHQLAARGHEVAAVDLTVNDFDGLGCHRFYETAFTPVQAEFDLLPFPDRSVDLVAFNASLHYATDYARTLGESLRVLKVSGLLVILDTPVYRDPGSGEQMIRERESQFLEMYGFASNSLPGEGYLTYTRLDELAEALDLKWELLTPYYHWRWVLRPLAAKILRRREPAKFHLILGRRNPD